MTNKLFISIFFFVIGTSLYSQTGIDYFPKKLQKELSISESSVNEIPLPETLASQIFLGKYFIISNNSNKPNYKYFYVGRVNTCRAGGCSVKGINASDLPSEYFDYFILFNSGGSIQLVRIFNYQATHGHEISSKGWLKQFNGYKGKEKLISNKNIDAISGATISVDATIMDIEHKTSLLQLIIKSFQ